VPTIWFDGVQLERASSASNFNALTNTNGVNVFDLISTNNGTASNITYNSDGYYSFNGTNSIITFPNNTAFDNQAFSVEVWVKTNALSQNGFWFEKGTVNTQYSLFQEGTAIHWRAHNGSYVNMVSVTTATYMNTTDWFHVVGTCISGSQVVYINGVSVGTGTTSGPFSTNNGGCSIGAYGGATGAHSYWYNGSIAIVKVYDRVLSAGEVVQNFSALRGRFGL
jgi:hypothetical protein